MRITLKLFASLGQFLPPGARENAIPADVPDGATVTKLRRSVFARGAVA